MGLDTEIVAVPGLDLPAPASMVRGMTVMGRGAVGTPVSRMGVGALLLCALSLAIRWPGVAMFDSVGQYEQALTGDYSDWHPPIMAHLWALLLRVWPGTAPFLLLQMAFWWGGFGLTAAALARDGRTRSSVAALAIGAFPLFLGWGTVVLKDAQMAACLVLATGLVAWWRLDGRALPGGAIAAIALLIGYATLVRGNAVFATVPFALAIGGWGGARRWWLRGGIALAGIGAVLAVSPLINNRLLGAEATHNNRSLPLWDIAAIAHRAELAQPPGVAADAWAAAERRGCYTPYFWNPYGEPALCDAIGQKLAFADEAKPGLMRDWAMLVARHPLAYAAHRIAHFNATTRFWVGADEPDALPPINSEPNTIGIGAPSSAPGRALVVLAGWANATPLGWPIVWLAAAAALLWGLGREAGAAAGLARALAISALAMSGSFAVASIASDLRYHLWSMIAVALALALAVPLVPLRRRRIGMGIVAGVAAVAIVARLVAAPVYVPLPPRPPAPIAAPA